MRQRQRKDETTEPAETEDIESVASEQEPLLQNDIVHLARLGGATHIPTG